MVFIRLLLLLMSLLLFLSQPSTKRYQSTVSQERVCINIERAKNERVSTESEPRTSIFQVLSNPRSAINSNLLADPLEINLNIQITSRKCKDTSLYVHNSEENT